MSYGHTLQISKNQYVPVVSYPLIFLLTIKFSLHHNFSLNLEVTIFLILLIFFNATFLSISQWFNQALVSLYQPCLNLRWQLRNSMVFDVIYFVLVQQEPSHSQDLNRGKTHFYKENRIWCIAFNFQVICYKMVMDLLNIYLGFSRDVATPNLTSIQDNMSD